MNKESYFNNISDDLKDKIHFLEDKPEETLESTLKALWFAAAGISVSAEKSISQLIPELTEENLKILNRLIDLRINNTPLAHITKRQNFMGIDFIADGRALIPRKETELLGNRALELSREIAAQKGNVKVIDVCCGSGNLGIALAHFNQKCKVFAADISQDSVDLALENVRLLNQYERVEVIQSDLFSGFESEKFYGKVDLIVCNPPYISTAKVEKMNQEIASNEPALAFDGGMLGLKIIQKLIREASRFLSPEGWLIFEVGLGQGDYIAQLCERTKLYQQIESVHDDKENIRVIRAQKYQFKKS